MKPIFVLDSRLLFLLWSFKKCSLPGYWSSRLCSLWSLGSTQSLAQDLSWGVLPLRRLALCPLAMCSALWSSRWHIKPGSGCHDPAVLPVLLSLGKEPFVLWFPLPTFSGPQLPKSYRWTVTAWLISLCQVTCPRLLANLWVCFP